VETRRYRDHRTEKYGLPESSLSRGEWAEPAEADTAGSTRALIVRWKHPLLASRGRLVASGFLNNDAAFGKVGNCQCCH
jgi:hypothetical protein